MHENHELYSLVSFKSLTLVYFLSWIQLFREMILICDENDSQENSLFSYFDMSKDDIDNDDVIEAKCPVRKSKRD